MMFATSKKETSSTTSSSKPVKSLSTKISREESKTPEIETVAETKKVTKKTTPKKQARGSPARTGKDKGGVKGVKGSPLSLRASRVKKQLKEKVDVDAVIIKEDGTFESIKYNGSSRDVNKLLNGRPTIIGEFEDIQCIIVRSLNQTNCGKKNEFILPVPFCNKQYNGKYLLYRVDAKGNALNLSVDTFKKFVADNKTLTDMARKNYDPVDNQEIKTKSSFNSNSRLTLVYLRSEVDKKVRGEFEKKNGKKPTDLEIRNTVNEELQKLVDELVLQSTPMNDPDYDPKQDESKSADNDTFKQIKKIYSEENGGATLSNKGLAKTLENAKQALSESVDQEQGTEFVDDRDWRLQLNDALNAVRARGRLDGRILARKISDTFYELNGIEPSLDELVDAFRRIQDNLALEAEEDLAEQSLDTGSAHYLGSKLGDLSKADPSDLIDFAFRIVREDLISRAKSSFNISKGRAPTKYELKDTVERLALKLADEALDRVDRLANIEDLDDDDYDPDNVADRRLAKQDALENKQFDRDFFNLRMLTTAKVKSAGGRSTKYDVYFCKFSKKRQERNLKRAIVTFKLRNKREPNSFEIQQIKKFISTKDTTNLIEFQLSVVGGDNDNDDVEETRGRTTKGIDIDEEVEEKSSELRRSRRSSLKKSGPTTPSKVLVTPVKKKKSAARYNVYFSAEKDGLASSKKEEAAIKWFKRFNNRSPNKLELGGIKQFIAADKSELTECEYDIPVELTFDKDDDRKETEEDDKILKKMRQKNTTINSKNKSTKYTLNFDDDEERENGDEKSALKWFKRFNNRKPTDSELEKIKNFIKADKNNNVVDID